MPQPNPAPSPDVPYEIGLVMAGAISAGAYTAGVVDFLIQALDEWQAAKAAGAPHCPPHDVIIKVLAGASAGGMTAGLAAGQLTMRFESVTALPEPGGTVVPRNNNLYKSWVNHIDIESLLETQDLDADADAPVQSALDSTIIRSIAANAFRYDDPTDRAARPYIADPLQVFVTVTNLRGVPYVVDFKNYQNMAQYEMTHHADYMHFAVGRNPLPADQDDGALRLDPDHFDTPAWVMLQNAAVATGAFPFGLAPQPLARSPLDYDRRSWDVPGAVFDPHGAITGCGASEDVDPFWPEVRARLQHDPSYTYQFLCVDGGVMNNEPLNLAHQALVGPYGYNPREGDKSIRAVIMVDPFPNVAPFAADTPPTGSLFGLLPQTFNALIAQARFKPDELVLAMDPDVYSRFLVIPRRGYMPDGKLNPNTIACGSLSGFGGFLCQRFREHDYQLGRRNCQWFLKNYFVLPKTNALFGRWDDQARQDHQVVIRRAGKPDVPTNLLPIIPLVGAAAAEIAETEWPQMTRDEFEALRPKVENRLNQLVDRLIDQNSTNWLGRQALKLAWTYERGSALSYVMDTTIAADLSNRKLLADG